jgi:hypothetical protein
MAEVQKGRFTADVGSLGDEVIVFLIGMRINKPWKVRAWWPIFVAMPKMLKYLGQHPDKGLLGYEQAILPSPMLVQYWRSFEDLARFARDRDDPTSSRGGSSTSALAAPATSEYGTRPIASGLRTSRRSTATCRPTGWLRLQPWSRLGGGTTRQLLGSEPPTPTIQRCRRTDSARPAPGPGARSPAERTTARQKPARIPHAARLFG